MNTNFLGTEKLNIQFMQAPSFLFNDEKYRALKPTSKLLYILLLERARLSQTNKWLDKDGSVYVYLTIEEAGMILNASSNCIVKAFQGLERFKLIKRIRQGFGKPTKIKLYRLNGNKSDVKKDNSHSRKKTNSHISKNEINVSQNPRSNNNYNKNNNKSNNKINREEEIKTLKENFGFNFLVEAGYDKNILELIADIMYDVNYSNRSYKINEDIVSCEDARRRLEDFDFDIAEYVCECTENALKTKDIKNLRGYVLTSLYNAPLTIDSYYENKVARDLAQASKKVLKDPYETDIGELSRIV